MFAKKSKDGQKMPQTIAHRGYKAKHPENTMGAFRGAIAIGTDAIETDVHITKDDIVVLSHVRYLRRTDFAAAYFLFSAGRDVDAMFWQR